MDVLGDWRNGIKKGNYPKWWDQKSVDSCLLSTGIEGVKIASRIPGIESSRIPEVPFGSIRCWSPFSWHYLIQKTWSVDPGPALDFFPPKLCWLDTKKVQPPPRGRRCFNPLCTWLTLHCPHTWRAPTPQIVTFLPVHLGFLLVFQAKTAGGNTLT